MHPVFNHVAPYRYLLPTGYLFVADIKNPDCLCVVVGPGIVSTLLAFMRSSASHPGMRMRVRMAGIPKER